MKKAIVRLLIAVFAAAAALAGADQLLRLVDPNRFAPKSEHPFQKPALYSLSKIKELGYELKPGAEVEVEGIKYRINRIGFRDIEHRLVKTDKRVIVVGDSLTFGWNVRLEDIFVSQTRKELESEGRTIEIVAMGIIGYNVRQEYHLIKERGLKLDPDLVLLQIGPNDIERALGIRTDPEQKFMLTQYGEISVPYVFKKTRFTRWLMAHSYLFKLLNLKFAGKPKAGDAPRDLYSEGTESATEYLRKTKILLAGSNHRLAAVVFPFRSDSMRPPYSDFHRAILKELADASIPALDLSAVLNSSAEGESLWVDFVHPNRAGNKLAAEKLADFIVSLLEGTTDGLD